MPEGLPSDPISQSGLLPGFTNVVLLDGVLVGRSARRRVCEQPSFRGRIAPLPMFEKNPDQRRVERNVVAGILSFDLAFPTVDDASLNQERAVLKLEVVPSKRPDLAGSETKASGDPYLRAVGFRD